jgi:hypothetical protein
MQQQNFDALIFEKKKKLNKSKKEEVIPKYKYVSLLYYREDHENEKFEQRVQKFEPPIHYVVEQEVTIQGIKMSIKVELVLVIK